MSVEGFSLEFEWQQVSLSLQDSSKYSDWSQQCCSLDSLHPSHYFQVLQSLYQSFGDCTELTITIIITVTFMFFQLPSKVNVLIPLLAFFQFYSVLRWDRKVHNSANSLFLCDYHLPPITKTIQVRRTKHAGHCWRSRDELIRDVLLWTPTHGRAKAGRPARSYIQQLCEDTGCCPEDLPEAMNDREKWWERVRDIRATSTTWWWWL